MIDIGTVSAFCALVPGQVPNWGTVDLSGPTRGHIAFNLMRWIDGLIDLTGPSLIGFESPYIPEPKKTVSLKNGEFFGSISEDERIPLNRKGVRLIHGMPLVVEAVAAARKIRCEEYPILDVYHFWTGRNVLDKRPIKKATTMRMCQMRGFNPDTEHAADVIAVAMYGEARHCPEISRKRGVGPLFLPRLETQTVSRGAPSARVGRR